jgi:hypothetical protein
MKRFKGSIVLCLLPLLISGCATVFVNPRGTKMDLCRYKTINVASVQVAKGVAVSSSVQETLGASIERYCQRLMPMYISGLSSSIEKDTLVLQTTITRYEPPAKGLMGILFRTNSLLEVKTSFLDGNTDLEIGQATFSTTFGGFGLGILNLPLNILTMPINMLINPFLNEAGVNNESVVLSVLENQISTKIGIALTDTFRKYSCVK